MRIAFLPTAKPLVCVASFFHRLDGSKNDKSGCFYGVNTSDWGKDKGLEISDSMLSDEPGSCLNYGR